MIPKLAITMGDPTGVGPEIIAKAWQQDTLHATSRPVVLGHPEVLRRALQLIGSPAEVVEVASVPAHASSPHRLDCLPCGTDDAMSAPDGQLDARGGEAAYQCIVRACELAQRAEVDAIVTAPINKAALAAAGHDYPGHTELLADLCSVDEVTMMLYLAPGDQQACGLGVAHVTLHVALREVGDLLSVERIVRTARLAHTVTSAMLAQQSPASPPRIGVCAMNPHGGEQGLFGDEEQRLIGPAVAQGCAAGLDLHGPLPADTLMARAAGGEFDAVVAMYHDQGHIALKLLTMHRAVNITLGLPVIRTSVAHGTAYDRAWQGTARCDSLMAAISVAAQLVRCRDQLHWE